MDESAISRLLAAHGIRPTANRLLIADALAKETYPMSMHELEEKIVTIDKSGIFRTLTLFRTHRLVHDVEDGQGNVRYELCMSHDADADDDLHVHFYCERCHHTFCLDDTPLPPVRLPQGFSMRSANYMVKGVCPDCAHRRER